MVRAFEGRDEPLVAVAQDVLLFRLLDYLLGTRLNIQA
jgi:hypothetical protein